MDTTEIWIWVGESAECPMIQVWEGWKWSRFSEGKSLTKINGYEQKMVIALGVAKESMRLAETKDSPV